jgi:hypothetical protein
MEIRDLCLPLWERGVIICMYVCMYNEKRMARWTDDLVKGRGSPLNGGGAGPVILELFGRGLCTAVDIFRGNDDEDD